MKALRAAAMMTLVEVIVGLAVIQHLKRMVLYWVWSMMQAFRLP